MAEGGRESPSYVPEDEDDRNDGDPMDSKSLTERFQDFFNISSNCKFDKKSIALKTLDLDGIVDYMMSGKCENVITMAGAGISTSAGIPDFRSGGSGIYSKLEKYKLPHPGAVFQSNYFKKHPEPFFELVRNLYPTQLTPTPCHLFVRLLNDKQFLLRHYTQNIDTLERLAGIPDEKVVEAHGSFHMGHCLKCNAEYSYDWLKENIFATTVPRCAKKDCDGVVKPDVVLFGENLPLNFYVCSAKDFRKCDLLIILGTSLVVQPFASLIHKVKKSTPRLYINLEYKEVTDIPIFGHASSFKYGKSNNYRDVYFKGTCDAGVTHLARRLGWEHDLKILVHEAQTKNN